MGRIKTLRIRVIYSESSVPFIPFLSVCVCVRVDFHRSVTAAFSAAEPSANEERGGGRGAEEGKGAPNDNSKK